MSIKVLTKMEVQGRVHVCVCVCPCECAHGLCTWSIFTGCVVCKLLAASCGSQIAQLAFAA